MAAQRLGWRWIVKQLAGVAIVVAAGWFFWQRRETFVQVVDVSVPVVLALAAGVLGSWVVVSWQSHLLYRAQGIAIGFWENLVVVVATNFGNYLPMRVGTIVRVRYMKQVHGLRYARFGSVTGMRLVLMLSASGLLGLIGILGLGLTRGVTSAPLTLLFGGLFALSALAFLTRLPRAPSTERLIGRVWNDFIEGFDVVRARPVMAAQVVALICAQYGLLAWRLQVSLAAVDVETDYFLLAMLGPLTALVSTVAITPGGIGVREALIGWVTFETGLAFDTGMFAAAIDRAVILCLIATVGAVCFGFIYWGMRAPAPPDEEEEPT